MVWYSIVHTPNTYVTRPYEEPTSAALILMIMRVIVMMSVICVYIYVYMYMYVCMYMYIHIHIYIYIHIHIVYSISLSLYIYIYIYISGPYRRHSGGSVAAMPEEGVAVVLPVPGKTVLSKFLKGPGADGPYETLLALHCRRRWACNVSRTQRLQHAK